MYVIYSSGNLSHDLRETYARTTLLYTPARNMVRRAWGLWLGWGKPVLATLRMMGEIPTNSFFCCGDVNIMGLTPQSRITWKKHPMAYSQNYIMGCFKTHSIQWLILKFNGKTCLFGGLCRYANDWETRGARSDRCQWPANTKKTMWCNQCLVGIT